MIHNHKRKSNPETPATFKLPIPNTLTNIKITRKNIHYSSRIYSKIKNPATLKKHWTFENTEPTAPLNHWTFHDAGFMHVKIALHQETSSQISNLKLNLTSATVGKKLEIFIGFTALQLEGLERGTKRLIIPRKNKAYLLDFCDAENQKNVSFLPPEFSAWPEKTQSEFCAWIYSISWSGTCFLQLRKKSEHLVKIRLVNRRT